MYFKNCYLSVFLNVDYAITQKKLKRFRQNLVYSSRQTSSNFKIVCFIKDFTFAFFLFIQSIWAQKFKKLNFCQNPLILNKSYYEDPRRVCACVCLPQVCGSHKCHRTNQREMQLDKLSLSALTGGYVKAFVKFVSGCDRLLLYLQVFTS